MSDDDRAALRNVILASQHLNRRSTQRVEAIVSDICGSQHDSNPAIHLNYDVMLWNRKNGLLRRHWMTRRIIS